MTKKNRLQAQIIEYQKRRAVFKKQNPNWKDCSKGRKRVENYYRKINIWQTTVRRIEKRERIIEGYAQQVCEFMGISTLQNCIEKNRYNHKKTDEVLARKIFYKYVIENNIHGGYVAEYMGAKDRATPCRGRLEFTRSFQTNIYHKEMWHRFKLFVADLKEDKIAA